MKIVVKSQFHQVSNSGKKLQPGADEFTAFLKTYYRQRGGPLRRL
jgi:hypothetical protein